MMLKNYTILVFALFLNIVIFAQNRFTIDFENHKTITKKAIEHLNKQNKSIETTKQSLDSLVRYSSDIDSPEFIIKFTYNDLGLTILQEEFSYESGTPEINYSLTYSYDTSNRLIELLVFESDGDPDSNDYFKTTFTYTEDDKLLQRLNYNYNETDDTWSLSYKRDYIYYDGGYEEISSNRTDDTWTPSYKVIYDLNDMELVTEETSYYWAGSDASEWTIQGKDVFSYNDDGKLLLKQSYYWDSIIEGWQQFDNRTQYVYDDASRLVLKKHEEYNTDTSTWFIYWQYAYTYTDDGNLDTFIRSSIYGSESGTDLELSGMGTYTYNNDFTFNDLLLPVEFFDEGEMAYFNHMLLSVEYYNWNSDTETWEGSEENTAFYYSPREIIGTSTVVNQTLGVYPNPFTSQLTFSISDTSENNTLAIFDIKGRRIYYNTISNQTNIDTKNLVSGVYFYRLQVNDKTYTGKVIKE